LEREHLTLALRKVLAGICVVKGRATTAGQAELTGESETS